MSLKSKFEYVYVIVGISMALLMTTPAMAVPVGTISLDITGGCFSFGAAGAPGCGNPNVDVNHKEYSTGSFVFDNSLSPLNPSTQNFSYDAFANLHATNGTTIFDDNRAQSFSSFLALTSDPRFGIAAGLVLAFGANPLSGSLSVSGVDLSWTSIITGSTPTGASGTFEIWSGNDLNVLSLGLFGRDLPLTEVSFNADARLEANAISEPVSLALIGISLLSICVLRRKMRRQS